MVAVNSGQADDSSPEDRSGDLEQEREIITRNAGISRSRLELVIVLNKMYNLRKYDNIHIFNRSHNHTDFGAVLNFTKQKMVNTRIDMSYFLLGENAMIQKLFSWFLKRTKIQGNEQLKFIHKTQS